MLSLPGSSRFHSLTYALFACGSSATCGLVTYVHSCGSNHDSVHPRRLLSSTSDLHVGEGR